MQQSEPLTRLRSLYDAGRRVIRTLSAGLRSLRLRYAHVLHQLGQPSLGGGNALRWRNATHASTCSGADRCS